MKPERIKHAPVIQRSITGITGLVGKAAVNEEFRKRFLADPAGVAKEYGLPSGQIEKIQRLDRKALEAAIKGVEPIAREEAGHSSAHSSGHSSGHSSAGSEEILASHVSK
jgi:hypothetical protein